MVLVGYVLCFPATLSAWTSRHWLSAANIIMISKTTHHVVGLLAICLAFGRASGQGFSPQDAPAHAGAPGLEVQLVA